MNAAGSLGFAPEPRSAIFMNGESSWNSFGAFITNPVSLRPRLPSANPQLIESSGCFLLHNGLPNPGLSAVLKKYSRRWAQSDIPIIVHLMADRPDETARMVRVLEGLENVVAIELGFAPLLAADIILMALEMSLGELPLIVNLPFDQVLTLGARVIQAGAAALSLAAPRGALPLPHNSTGAPLITGRLYGPALFPQSLDLVCNACRLGLPVIAGVGVYGNDNAMLMLKSGALAIQVDTALWRGDWLPLPGSFSLV